MAKKFNAASISTSKLNTTTNNTEIEFISDKNERLQMNLSPEARQRLLTALLMRSQSPNALNVLRSNGVRYLIIEKAIPGLEFSFGNNMAIPIVFPKESILELKKQIADLEENLAQDQKQKH